MCVKVSNCEVISHIYTWLAYYYSIVSVSKSETPWKIVCDML